MKPLNIFGKQVPIIIENIDDKGLFDRTALTITIQKGMSKEETKLTLLHELVHAMCKIGGLHQAIPEELEEVFCEQFASVIDENFHLRRK